MLLGRRGARSSAPDAGAGGRLVPACLAVLTVLAGPTVASAQRETTRAALDHLEETLAMRVEDGLLEPTRILPLLIVSVTPLYEESRHDYPTAALSVLTRVFGTAGLRLCEACMAPRTFVEEGRLELTTGPVSVPELIRLDESLRGDSLPARTAIWLDETEAGVSLRVVELGTSRIVLAENLDPNLVEQARTRKNLSLTRELDRRARGESITQTFIDITMYPGQHFSLDWTEQWGDTNRNLSGFCLSLWDPVVGLGGVYYRAVPEAFNLLVGLKVIMSVPTALVRSFGHDEDVVDRLLTGVFVVRVPIARSNYGVELSASTNGNVGVGLSLLNFSVLPVLP